MIMSYVVRATDTRRNQRPCEIAILALSETRRSKLYESADFAIIESAFARSPGCMNEILSLNASRHCFIEYWSFIKLWMVAPARSSASKFQPDLEHESGTIHQFPADGQMPLNFLPVAELSENLPAYQLSRNGSMNLILLPLILPTPISTRRFCSQI